MVRLVVLLLISLAFLLGEARLGPYYAHTCSGQTTKLHCPGDFVISFNGMIYTQYPKNYSLSCGTVTPDDRTWQSVCSALIAASDDRGDLVEIFQKTCVGRGDCNLKLDFPNAISSKCNSTDIEPVIRVMYSCVVTTAQDQVVVCSDLNGGPVASQILACPASTVIRIDKILAASITNGSSCSRYIKPGDDFSAACTYSLTPTHDFYRLIDESCSGWTSCEVKGTLVDNPSSNALCAKETKRNFQRIYYSCVQDQNNRITFCANDDNEKAEINCQGSYIKITNVIADRIYNPNRSNCPVDVTAKNFAVFGCATAVQQPEVLNSITLPCNGKTSCSLSLSEYKSEQCGPESSKTRNWFAISYQCTKTPEVDGYLTARACTGSPMNLTCPANTILSIGSIYASVLFATGNEFGNYVCNLALSLGNSEVTACTIQLSSNGLGSTVYKSFEKCNGQPTCQVPLDSTVKATPCVDYNKALDAPRKYEERNLFNVLYACTPKMSDSFSSSSSDSTSTPVNSVGLGLGLAALVLVIIGAIVGVVVYRRRHRDGMTTKMSAPSAGNNYSNF